MIFDLISKNLQNKNFGIYLSLHFNVDEKFPTFLASGALINFRFFCGAEYFLL